MSCCDSLDEGPWAAILVMRWPLDTRQWAAILVMIDYQWHAEGKTRIKLVVQQAVVSTQDGRRTSGRWESHASTNPQWHLQLVEYGGHRELVALDTRLHKAQGALPLPLNTLHNRQRLQLAHQRACLLMKK